LPDTIYIIGHRNPDTDSVCSAIGYADLKRRLGEQAEARILGAINRETEFVLNYFNVEVPEILDNVKTQISDLDIDRVSPISPNISINTAWNRMKAGNNKTLPVADHEGRLIGIISLSDITKKYMDALDSNYIISGKTSLGHIVDTINAAVHAGNDFRYKTTGKVVIAVDDKETVCSLINKGDIVITGNRSDVQKTAIECGANMVIVTGSLEADKSVAEKAEQSGCILLSTPLDAYSVARLINQSAPIHNIMTKDKLITFNIDDFVDDIKEIMLKTRFRSYPVVDENMKIYGFITRFHLLSPRKKKVILVDHNEKNQTVKGIEDAEILEIIDHHKLGDIETATPIFFKNEPVGSTSTIIGEMFFSSGISPAANIAGILCAAIISDTVKFQSPTCTYRNRRMAEKLADIAGIDIDEFAIQMFEAATEIKGKTYKEIFHQDLKNYQIKKYNVAISQITVMGKEACEEVMKGVIEYVSASPELAGYDIVLSVFIDITRNSTRVHVTGPAREIGYRAFNIQEGDGIAVIPSIMSRKKQIFPKIMAEIEREGI